MCVVSMTGDYFNQKWGPLRPHIVPNQSYNPGPSQYDFDRLKREVEDLKALLKLAKEYDKKNNEPDCEIEDNMKFLREVAKSVGIDLDDVIKPKK